MGVRVIDPDGNVMVEEQNLDRAVFKLEVQNEGTALFYPHVDQHEVHMRVWNADEGSWSVDEPVILTVEEF
jgi:hypothetical protein